MQVTCGMAPAAAQQELAAGGVRVRDWRRRSSQCIFDRMPSSAPTVSPTASPAMSPAKAWLLALRPKTLPAAAAPVAVGAALGAFRDSFLAGPVLGALLGALLIQIATNLANDYFDFRRGADAERVGPTRVTQSGLISPEAVMRGTLLALVGALLVGVYLVWVGGLPIVVIGLVSLVCAIAYTGGPFPLAYHGLGDLFVFVFFGLVAVGGTVYLQLGAFPAEAWLAGAGVGFLSTAILVVNNLRDRPTDAAVGKRTMAVRLGDGGSRVEYILMLVGAGAVPLVGMALYDWPSLTLAALLGIGLALRPLKMVMAFRERAELIPALPATAAALIVYSVGLALGLVLGG